MIVGRWLIYGRMSFRNKYSSNVVPLKTFSQSTNFIDVDSQVCHYPHHAYIFTDAGTERTGQKTLSACFGTELLACEFFFEFVIKKKKKNYIKSVKQCELYEKFTVTQESCLLLLHLH